MPYAIRRNIILLTVALLGCAPAACGKKGPLYLPDQPRQSAAPLPAGGAPTPPQTEPRRDQP